MVLPMRAPSSEERQEPQKDTLAELWRKCRPHVRGIFAALDEAAGYRPSEYQNVRCPECGHRHRIEKAS